MKSDLSKRIADLLKATDALETEYEADPFGAEVIEARGSMTAAQAMIDEAAAEPDSLSPEEIIRLRQDGANALEAATISHRRADSKRDQYYDLLGEKLSELKGDVVAVIRDTTDCYQSKIEAAVIELTDGYFSQNEKGYTVPKAIANHRARTLKRHFSTLDNSTFATPTAEKRLQQIRAALEACLQHLS